MELSQKNINFGSLSNLERHQKSFVIRNLSDAPLLYMIHKKESIALGDIQLPRRFSLHCLFFHALTSFYFSFLGLFQPIGRVWFGPMENEKFLSFSNLA